MTIRYLFFRFTLVELKEHFTNNWLLSNSFAYS
jgi:hypothetical protein